MTLGGVARNMAETATRVLSAATSSSAVSPVKLISPHGDDDFGLLLRTGMHQVGMRTDGLFIPANGLTESTTAVCSLMLEDGGDLISGVADMDIGRTALYPQDASKDRTLQGMLKEEAAEVIAFDGNIGSAQAAELLTACEAFNTDRKGKQLLTLFEPTSIAKSTIALEHFAATTSNAHRSRPISFATPNAVELEQIHSEAARLGLVPALPAAAPSANVSAMGVEPSTLDKALALVSHGIFTTILLKVGRHGVVTIDADRIRHHPIPAGEVHVVNTTGCGDSFAGAFVATLSHLLQRQPSESKGAWHDVIDTAVEVGQLAARNTLASSNAVGEGMHLLLDDHAA